MAAPTPAVRRPRPQTATRRRTGASHADRRAVLPLAEHEEPAFERRSLPLAEAHRGAGGAEGRRQKLDPLECVLDPGSREVLGAGHGLADEPAEVVPADEGDRRLPGVPEAGP